MKTFAAFTLLLVDQQSATLLSVPGTVPLGPGQIAPAHWQDCAFIMPYRMLANT